MLPADSPSIPTGLVDTDSLFSGLVKKSSEGTETVDYLSAVASFGRCIAAGPDPAVLFHDACELAALVIQADMLLVAQLAADGRNLKLQIASFNEKGKVIVQKLEAISAEPDISMAGYAMHSADVVQCEDIVAERRFTDLLLRRLKMGSGICVPLCCQNRAFGALGVIRKAEGSFRSDETKFTTGIAQLLASYLAQNDAEEEMRSRQVSMRNTLDSVESLILFLDEQGVVCEMNAAGIRMSGFRDRELRDRPFWNTLIAPEDSERVGMVFRKGLRDGITSTFEADLLSKEGQHLAVHWALRSMQTNEGASRAYVLSGIDRTELREATQELEKYRRIAQGATEAAEQSSVESNREHRGQTPTGAEKRSSPRREYNYMQRISPLIDNCIPDDDEFYKVPCCDISAGGFSYYMETPPHYDELVISLGTPPHDQKVIAKIVRIVKKDVNGQTMHQVGCQFTGRVNK